MKIKNLFTNLLCKHRFVHRMTFNYNNYKLEEHDRCLKCGKIKNITSQSLSNNIDA